MNLEEFAVTFASDLATNSTELLIWSQLPIHVQVMYVLCKTLYGGIVSLRKKRSNDFFAAIAEHADKFTSVILNNEQVQDAFMLVFQQYITERNEQKRKAIFNILLGFISEEDKENFELEKMASVLRLVSVEDIEVVRIWVDGGVEDWLRSQGIYQENQIEAQAKRGLNPMQYGDLILSQMRGMVQFSDKQYTFEKLNYLVGIGLLSEDIGTSFEGNGDFAISTFGKKFLRYIQEL